MIQIGEHGTSNLGLGATRHGTADYNVFVLQLLGADIIDHAEARALLGVNEELKRIGYDPK
jgi:hypothetical protein